MNTAVMCELDFSALFEQVKPAMGGLILTTNTATESREIFIGVRVMGVRAADKILHSLKSLDGLRET